MLPNYVNATLLAFDEDAGCVSSLLFQCLNEMLNKGYHVHFLSSKIIEEMPLSIHGTEKPFLESFDRLSVKYFSDTNQLIQYSCELTQIKLNKGRLPKAILINDLETYFTDDYKTVLALSLLIDALGALGRSFGEPVFLIAALRIPSSGDRKMRTLPSICDNFFSTVWIVSVSDEDKSVVEMECEKWHLTKARFEKTGSDVLIFRGVSQIVMKGDTLNILSSETCRSD